jgi:cobalamin synthase
MCVFWVLGTIESISCEKHRFAEKGRKKEKEETLVCVGGCACVRACVCGWESVCRWLAASSLAVCDSNSTNCVCVCVCTKNNPRPASKRQEERKKRIQENSQRRAGLVLCVVCCVCVRCGYCAAIVCCVCNCLIFRGCFRWASGYLAHAKNPQVFFF